MMLVKVPTAMYHPQFQYVMFQIVLLVNVSDSDDA
jgi:hypothetical protein